VAGLTEVRVSVVSCSQCPSISMGCSRVVMEMLRSPRRRDPMPVHADARLVSSRFIALGGDGYSGYTSALPAAGTAPGTETLECSRADAMSIEGKRSAAGRWPGYGVVSPVFGCAFSAKRCTRGNRARLAKCISARSAIADLLRSLRAGGLERGGAGRRAIRVGTGWSRRAAWC